MNFIGASTFSILGYFYVKKRGKGAFTRQFLPRRKTEMRILSVLPEKRTGAGGAWPEGCRKRGILKLLDIKKRIADSQSFWNNELLNARIVYNSIRAIL